MSKERIDRWDSQLHIAFFPKGEVLITTTWCLLEQIDAFITNLVFSGKEGTMNRFFFLLQSVVLFSVYGLKFRSQLQHCAKVVTSVSSAVFFFSGVSNADVATFKSDIMHSTFNYPSEWVSLAGTLSGDRKIEAFADPSDR